MDELLADVDTYNIAMYLRNNKGKSVKKAMYDYEYKKKYTSFINVSKIEETLIVDLYMKNIVSLGIFPFKEVEKNTSTRRSIYRCICRLFI